MQTGDGWSCAMASIVTTYVQTLQWFLQSKYYTLLVSNDVLFLNSQLIGSQLYYFYANMNTTGYVEYGCLNVRCWMVNMWQHITKHWIFNQLFVSVILFSNAWLWKLVWHAIRWNWMVDNIGWFFRWLLLQSWCTSQSIICCSLWGELQQCLVYMTIFE